MNLTFREELKGFWELRSAREKLIVAGLALIVSLGLISGWFTAFKSWNEAQTAKRDAEKALSKAVVIAEQIREKETELNKLETDLNEKQIEVDNAKKQDSEARADYDRARRESVGRTPSADELCAELKQLGYPCK